MKKCITPEEIRKTKNPLEKHHRCEKPPSLLQHGRGALGSRLLFYIFFLQAGKSFLLENSKKILARARVVLAIQKHKCPPFSVD